MPSTFFSSATKVSKSSLIAAGACAASFSSFGARSWYVAFNWSELLVAMPVMSKAWASPFTLAQNSAVVSGFDATVVLEPDPALSDDPHAVRARETTTPATISFRQRMTAHDRTRKRRGGV